MEFRKWFVVVEMRKLVIKISVLIVSYLNHIIYYPKCTSEIFANLVVMDFNGPVVNVFSIEEINPHFGFFFGRAGEEKNAN